jgi:hypothetical protein
MTYHPNRPMRFKAPIITAIVLASLSCASWLLAQPPQAISVHPFPMAPGTSWVYQGEVHWQDQNNTTHEEQVSWRTEVRKLVEHPGANARVASIYGYPSDLDWTDGKPDVEYRALVESGGRFYLLSADTLPAILNRLDDPNDNLRGLLNAEDLVLEWPLGQGWRFCDPKGIVRDDQLYCWFVENITPSTLRMPGLKTVPRDEYQLSYKTNPDQVSVSFVPDIGITHYEYRLHGSITDTTLVLTEFHPVEAKK